MALTKSFPSGENLSFHIEKTVKVLFTNSNCEALSSLFN